MRKTVLIFCLVTPLFSQSSVETNVLKKIQEMMQGEDKITFSELYNSQRFGTEERTFLGRLYEVFFQIPRLLKSEYEQTGKAPTRQQIAGNFGISDESVDLLLAVMASDPRVPPLFARNPESKEIKSVNLQNIEAFIHSHGDQSRMTEWEGNPLPTFELTTFQGDRLHSADLQGKNVLLYFWFTGCPPCEKIAPLLSQLDRQYASSNFQIIGFNADRVLGLSTADLERQEYLTRHKVGFLNAHLDQVTRRAFGNVNIYPTLFFVKPDGVIVRHLVNFQNRDTLERVIAQLTKGE